MTDRLDEAVAAVRKLDPAGQDEIASILDMLASQNDDEDLTPEDEAAIALSEAESSRGEFATDEQVAAMWRRHGL
jgi:hypothetical protein